MRIIVSFLLQFNIQDVTDQNTSSTMASPSRPITATSRPHGGSIARSPFNSSFLSASPLAQESIARDIAASSDDEEDAASSSGGDTSDNESEASTVRPSHQMAGSYRRPSFVAFGGTRPAIAPQHAEVKYLTKKEKAKIRMEEESLLRDNRLAPPKHAQREEERSLPSRIYRKLFSTKLPERVEDEEAVDPLAPVFTAEPSEISALLPSGPPESIRERHERSNRIWEAAVKDGKIKTSWQREAKTLATYSAPLIVTFLLQYSLTVASIFTVGHLGKIELGAGTFHDLNYQVLLTFS